MRMSRGSADAGNLSCGDTGTVEDDHSTALPHEPPASQRCTSLRDPDAMDTVAWGHAPGGVHGRHRPATLRRMSTPGALRGLDDDLAREVAQRAARRGEPAEQFVAEVLRRHFLLEVFERIWSRNPHELTEEQARTLANEELDAMRAERSDGLI